MKPTQQRGRGRDLGSRRRSEEATKPRHSPYPLPSSVRPCPSLSSSPSPSPSSCRPSPRWRPAHTARVLPGDTRTKGRDTGEKPRGGEQQVQDRKYTPLLCHSDSSWTFKGQKMSNYRVIPSVIHFTFHIRLKLNTTLLEGDGKQRLQGFPEHNPDY